MVFHGIFMILLSCTHFLGVALGPDPKPSSKQEAVLPQTPSLLQLRSVGDRVVFLCRAPEGHQGLRFELYGNKVLCDMVQHQTEECGAIFTVNRQNVTREKPFCCLYKDAHHIPSAFSSYVYAKLDEDVSPLPPPVLVSTSSEVQAGQMLSLHCSVPLCLRPKAFLLLSQGTGSSGSPNSLLRSSSPNPSFSVAAADGGLYSCLYQMSHSTGLRINSSASLPVQVTVSDEQNTAKQTQDWPLVVGAISASVLFLAVVVGLALAVCKKVKEVAKEKKRREDAKFWSTVHARDHIVDLPISRLSISFKDTRPVSAEYADPASLATFTNASYS